MKFTSSAIAENPRTTFSSPNAEKNSSDGSNWSKRTHAVVAFLVGTGGLATPCFVAERGDRGYRIPGIEYSNLRSRSLTAPARTASQNLSRVREIFGPSMTELAALFGVSRQAVYNWLAGQAVSEENGEQLAQLAAAADVLAAEGLSSQRSLVKRKLGGGKTFLQAVYGGEPPASAAYRLVSMLKSELAQGATVSTRLASRKRKAIDLADIAGSHLNEHS